MLRILLPLLWCAAAAGQRDHRLRAPERAMAGERIVLTVEGAGAGVEIRVIGPAKELGVVAARAAAIRKEPGTAQPPMGVAGKGDRLLLLQREGEVVVPSGAAAYLSCSMIEARPFGQPLGVTDERGRLITEELTAAPAEIEIAAVAGGSTVATAKLRVLPLEYDRREAIAPGISYRERRFVRQGDGPFTMQILEVDPAVPAVDLAPVRARDRAIGRETVSSMAARHGAAAAVNGGYFVVSGTYAGAPAGVMQLNRVILSAGRGRTAASFCQETDFVERAEIGVVNFRGRVVAEDGAARELAGVNRARVADELILYQPAMGPATLTDAGGVEVALVSSRVVTVEDGKGNTAIPRQGVVISGAGAAASWLREHARAGSELRVETELPAACEAVDIVGAGPRMVSGGKAGVVSEGFAHENVRHPRTALAVTGEGRFCS